MTRVPGAGPARAVGIAIACLATVTATPARGQHAHHGDHHAAPGMVPADEPPFEVGLSAIGGRFDQAFYAGDYVGAGLAVSWRRGPLTLHAALAAYHLRRNGAAERGIGDHALGVDALIVQAGAVRGGVTLSATLPTGDARAGLGMGHPMLMPTLWAERAGARTSLGVSLGWCGAVGGDRAHDHGAWPLVEPMCSSELMAEAHGDLALGGPLHAVGRMMLAVPLQGDATRLVATIGAGWHRPRTDTGLELQAGLAGDPFTLRALLTSALRF